MGRGSEIPAVASSLSEASICGSVKGGGIITTSLAGPEVSGSPQWKAGTTSFSSDLSPLRVPSSQ